MLYTGLVGALEMISHIVFLCILCEVFESFHAETVIWTAQHQE